MGVLIVTLSDKMPTIKISNENTKEIVSLYNNGETVTNIARKFKVSRRTIYDHINKTKEGVVRKWKRWSKEEMNQLEKLHSDGKNDYEMSVILGRSKAVVTNKRYELDLKCNPMLQPGQYSWDNYHYENVFLKYQKIVRLYLNHKELSFKEIASMVYDIDLDKITNSQESKIKITIGQHLTRVCRSKLGCPFKALLPETKIEEIT